MTSVQLRARSKLVGGGSVPVSGSVAPARGGVPVELSAKTRSSVVKRLTTKADGTFATSIPVKETTRAPCRRRGHRLTDTQGRRVVEGPDQGQASAARSRAHPGDGASEAARDECCLLRTTSAVPAARTVARKGRFSFRFKNLRRGRYQAVFIPSKGRAERATSNKGVIR